MPQTTGGAGDEEALHEETSLMRKDLLAIQEIMHISNAANKDTSLATAPKGNGAATTMRTSLISTMMTKNTMTTTLRNNQPTQSTTSKLDLLISLEMIKPN